jgi:hypothetical protein
MFPTLFPPVNDRQPNKASFHVKDYKIELRVESFIGFIEADNIVILRMTHFSIGTWSMEEQNQSIIDGSTCILQTAFENFLLIVDLS